MTEDKDLITQLQTENEQLRQDNIILQAQIAQLQALPAVANVLAINKLAAQIVQKTQVQ